MKQIAIFGAGGFGREIACMIQSINQHFPTWDLIGFFDDGLPEGHSTRYGKVLGGMERLNTWKNELAIVFSIANPGVLSKLIDKIDNSSLYFPNLIAPDVLFLDKTTVRWGEGNIVFHNCKISCDVTIGNFNLLNGTVSLGHDVQVGDRNVLGPMVRISGNSEIGNENFFGVQSIVLQGLRIGNQTRIGAGSVVMRNTKDGHLYHGNPAKKMDL